jgi:spore germination protein
LKRKYLLAISAALLIVVAVTCAAMGYYSSSVGIRINGQSRFFQPPAEILNNRTMVPIRFIIEDEALNGQVTWKNQTNQVVISCLNKNFEFNIGSRQVKVNGKTYYLDVAPYVHNYRTFVPLRFIAEQLGATVGWNNLKREVTIDFNQSSDRVFAYYYRSPEEFKQYGHLFTDVAFRWFETNGRGELFYEYKDNYDEILAIAKSKGIKCHASVVLMDKIALHELLSSPQNRAVLVKNIVTQVNSGGYDGVNIDFEFIPADDKGLFITFLRELKAGLGPEKTLSAAVFARTSSDKWPTGYDYEQIGQIADLVVVMAYDYHYRTSDAGPIAPLWWVKNVVDYLSSIMAPGKILLGVPTYGYDWASGVTTSTVTIDNLDTLRKTYKVTENFDNEQMSPCYTYTDSNGAYHQIWLENEKSLSAKLQLAKDNHLAGISFWRIGNNFIDLYNLLEK